MPSKPMIASFAAGIVVGATFMGAIGLRNSSAQLLSNSGNSGIWQLGVYQGSESRAFRLDTSTGLLEECRTIEGSTPFCVTMPPPK